MGLRIKKGDMVLVLSGNDAGSQGRVLDILPKKNAALVERLNLIKKHTRAKSQTEPGGIHEKEAPIPLSRLMLVDPKTGIASRFRSEMDANGNKIRKSVKTNNEI